MELNYKGLSNIGATCYMNSLLQTLFMTPEFREAIYKWKYDEKIHPKCSDSIIYQLQRLFGKLNKDFPGEVSTRDLVKSFQWQDQQAQMQQDIQEFNRVLFEALQKSLQGRKKMQSSERSHFMRDLYEGQMVAYTKCNECEYQSQRGQIFQDVILNIKNVFEKIYNGSIELAIQRYMKPEYLDENNLYECSGCLQKVKAQRGVKFLKVPKLLNIILRRFDFDFFTFQRIKVNDRVQFPFVLNFNSYMNGYHNIKDKLNEDSSAYFMNENVKPKNFPKGKTTQMKTVKKDSKKPVPVGKKVVTTSAKTKNFLEEIRKKKMMSQQNDDLIFVSGPPPPENRKVQSTTEPIVQENFTPERKLSKSQPTSQQINIEELNKDGPQLESKMTKETKDSDGKAKDFIPPPPPPPTDVPVLTEPYMKVEEAQKMQDQILTKIKEKQKLNSQIQESLVQNTKIVAQLTQKYLEDGPLVYELYAVLVHNGTATHGHYFSYIKSFENGRWYCFNDERVTQVNVLEVQKTFGGSGHSNAYALYYRLVEKERNQLELVAPQYINRLLEQQVTNMKKKEVKRVQDLQNILTLKIHYQLYVRQLQINKSSSLSLCLDKARQMFELTEDNVKKSNSRLRMFNAVSETKLQTFTGRQEETLQNLKIYSFKSLLLQTKKEQEKFEQYVIGLMNLRVVFWEECGQSLKSLDECHLKLHTIFVPFNGKMNQIQSIVKAKRKQVLGSDFKEDICIVKRHQNDEYSYHEVVNMNQYQQKTLQEVMINENEIIFIELDSNDLMWPQQFDNELYRITIKYNNPLTSQSSQYMTDSRKTLLYLKTELCKIIGVETDDLIMRRGTKSGLQLKNLALSMKESKFITGTQLYFEKGIPAKAGQIRVQLSIAKDAPNQMFNRLHQFEFIGDVPVNGLHRASEVKETFMKVVKKYQGLELQKDKFRIREKANDKMGKIYREKPMKEQQLIQKRQIAIEMKQDTIDMKDYSIYVRVWDPLEWTLSDKIQITVTKLTSMKDLAHQVYSMNSLIPPDEMEICRILSIRQFNITLLCQMEYYQITQASVIAEPLFVNTDGLLYVVKNSTIQPRYLTKEEEKKFGGQIKLTSRLKPRPTDRNYKKQKGVTIKVVEKEVEEDKDKDKKVLKIQEKTEEKVEQEKKE